MSQFPPEQLAIYQQCYHPSRQWIPFTDKDVQQSIPARFSTIVDHYRENIAFKSLAQSLTYGELNNVNFHEHTFIDPEVAGKWRLDYKIIMLSEETRTLAEQYGYEMN